MLIVGCSRGKHLAQKIAKKLKKPYSDLKVKKFPDNEIGIRFMSNVKGKEIVLVQSFYGNVNDCIVEVLFAVETAHELGAKKVALVAPYFPYLRKDVRYEPGECISGKAVSNIMSKYFDKVYVVDPHIKKGKKLSELFSKAKQLTAIPYIVSYIRNNIKNPLILGPDQGSTQMVKAIANKLRSDYVVTEKKRYSGRKVKVKLREKIDFSDKNVVFVDDIISTGNTILECAKNLKKIGARKFTCVVVHGIFVENALEKLRKVKIKVVTTNTLPNKVAKIDISGLIADTLKNKIR